MQRQCFSPSRYPCSFLIVPIHFSVVNAQITQQRDWNLDPLYTGVTVGIFTFLFIVSYIIFYYCLRGYFPPGRAGRSQRALHLDDSARYGLDPTVLKTFPVFMYSEKSGLRPNLGQSECAVCLGPFEASELLRLLPICDHVFHMDCVDQWLSSRSTCPLCRSELDCQPVSPTWVDPAGFDDLEIGLGGGTNEVGNDIVGETGREVHREGQYRKFMRSNSTGHVADVGWVDVHNELLEVKINRSKSCNAVSLRN